jgi:hypothetical protein
MRLPRTFAVLLLPVTAMAFPPTMWPRPADITEWTDPLEAVWSTAPAYSGTVASTWTSIPIASGAKVLCIGNSLSGWGAPINENLPAVYSYLNPGSSIDVKLMGRGSAWLRDYINETELGILDSIRSGRYDILVVQPWQDAMWPRSGSLDENRNRNLDSLMSHFVRPCDSLYRECAAVGTQMVLWSPNGSQFDDRLVYMTYSAFNCRKIAERLNIPYAFTVEAFDSCYLNSDNAPMVWYDAVHESPEMSAMYSILLYNVLTGGGSIAGLPQNWLDIPGTQWATAYVSTARTDFIRQDLLTYFAQLLVPQQALFNSGGLTVTLPRAVQGHPATGASTFGGAFTVSGRQTMGRLASGAGVYVFPAGDAMGKTKQSVSLR